jgi:hypothetical protein
MGQGRSAGRRRLTQLTPLALCALASCVSSLPDAEPFTRASAQLRAAVAESGRSSVSELRRLRESDPAPEAAATIAGLESAWAARVAALDAMVDYAAQVEALTRAGTSGNETVGMVADKLEQLADSAGIKALTGAAAPAVGPVLDVAKFVYGQIALARAAASLEDALAQAQPAVARIVSVLGTDMDDLWAALATCLEAQRSELLESHQVELAFRANLLAQRHALYALSGALDDAKSQEVAQLLHDEAALGSKPSDAAQAKALRQRAAEIYRSASALNPDQSARLRELSEQLAGTDEWYQPLQAQLELLEERRSAEHLLLAATRRGLDGWAVAHDALRKALRADRKRSPSFAALVASTREIKSLVERIDKL